MLLIVDALSQLIEAPAGCLTATAYPISRAQCHHVVDIFHTYSSNEAANVGISYILFIGKHMPADEREDTITILFGQSQARCDLLGSSCAYNFMTVKCH